MCRKLTAGGFSTCVYSEYMFDKNANSNWFHVCGQCHNEWYLFKGNSQVGATHPLCRKLVSNGTEPSIVGGEVPRLGTPGASISS